jgi:hypothetical protein
VFVLGSTNIHVPRKLGSSNGSTPLATSELHERRRRAHVKVRLCVWLHHAVRWSTSIDNARFVWAATDVLVDFDKWLRATGDEAPSCGMQTPPWRDLATSDCCDQTTEKRGRDVEDLSFAASVDPAAPAHEESPTSTSSGYSCIAVEGTPLRGLRCGTGHDVVSQPAELMDNLRDTRAEPSPIDKMMQLMVAGPTTLSTLPGDEPAGGANGYFDTATRNLLHDGFNSDDDSTCSSGASDSSDESSSFISVNELAEMGIVDPSRLQVDPSQPLVRQLVDLMVSPCRRQPVP